MNNLERLQNTLNGLKELDRKNVLRSLDKNETNKNYIIVQTAIDMVQNIIANGAVYNVPYPKIIPTTTQLINNIFTSSVAIFNTYLVQLAYKIDAEVPLDTTSSSKLSASKTAAINFLLKFLPSGSKNIKPLIYNCMNIIDNNNTWGGFIMEFNGASFIALRGTVYSCEAYEDSKIILYKPTWISLNCMVHGGFNNMYSYGPLKDNIKSLRDQIWEYLNISVISKLFVSAHSLGAGIMYLLEADITIKKPLLRSKTNFYSLAGPYPGNQDFINIIMSKNVNRNYTGTFNIINTNDFVPNNAASYYARVPYQLFCFSDPTLTVVQSHYIDNYRKNLENITISKVFDMKALSGYASCGQISCAYEPTTTYPPLTKVKITDDGQIIVESSMQNNTLIIILIALGILFFAIICICIIFKDKIKTIFKI